MWSRTANVDTLKAVFDVIAKAIGLTLLRRAEEVIQ